MVKLLFLRNFGWKIQINLINLIAIYRCIVCSTSLQLQDVCHVNISGDCFEDSVWTYIPNFGHNPWFSLNLLCPTPPLWFINFFEKRNIHIKGFCYPPMDNLQFLLLLKPFLSNMPRKFVVVLSSQNWLNV